MNVEPDQFDLRLTVPHDTVDGKDCKLLNAQYPP